jgi:hypothetical protein
MRHLLWATAVFVVLATEVACHPGPVIGGGHQPSVGGTISGIVSASAGSVALPSRKVVAIDVATNKRYETTTASNGGYTIQVPEGTYHIDVELRPGESFAKRPADTHVNNSDLDAGRDFVITAKPGER